MIPACSPRSTIAPPSSLPSPAGRTAPPPLVRGPRPVCAELTRAHQALLFVAPKQGPPV